MSSMNRCAAAIALILTLTLAPFAMAAESDSDSLVSAVITWVQETILEPLGLTETSNGADTSQVPQNIGPQLVPIGVAQPEPAP